MCQKFILRLRLVLYGLASYSSDTLCHVSLQVYIKYAHEYLILIL